MRGKVIFVVFLLFVFSCASQPSGGSAGGSTSSRGIVISTTDGSQTIESIPDLKLKLKDMPDSLSDESLKLKSFSIKNMEVNTSEFEKVRLGLWNNLALQLQKQTRTQEILKQLKDIAKLGSIPQGETVFVTNESYTNKVKFRTDGGGGIEFLFSIWTNDMSSQLVTDNQIYLHVYPVGSKVAFDLIGKINTQGQVDNTSYKVYAYYNEATDEFLEGAFYTDQYVSYIDNFFKSYGNISSGINLVLAASGEDEILLWLCYADSDKAGIRYTVLGSTDFSDEVYNNIGDLIFTYNQTINSTNSYYSLKYLSLKNSSYKVGRGVANTAVNTYYAHWEGKATNVQVYFTNYAWWIETNNNINDTDIPISVLEELSYIWSTQYNMVIPGGNIAYLCFQEETLSNFSFKESNRVNAIKPNLNNIYQSWTNSNYIYIITNRTIPNF
ncbi:MAG: hypothetical protein N2258_01440 [Brevinematales bacterium]|nr:hypothetical protein [Brevinematales bacterium]